MLIRLFDVEAGVLTLTESCYALPSLKVIMEEFPTNYLKVYLYIFYKTCSDPKMNPFFNLPSEEREEIITSELKIDFSLDHPAIINALEFCETLYDTPTKRAYDGMKILMDKLAGFFKKQELSTGRDGSLTAMISAGEKYQSLRQSFKGIEKDYMEEISKTRGDSFTAYDMR